MKNTTLTLALVCSGLFTGAGAQAQIKIGFIGPLSGPAAALGQDQYDGLMLAIRERQGKLGGQTVTVIKEDDQVKPEVAVNAVRKLIDRDRVDALVGLGYTNVLTAMLPRIVQSGTVAIATNSGPLALSGAGCKANVFSTAWQSDGPAEAMGVYAQEKKLDKLYLMAPNYQAGKEMIAGFKRYYKGKVVDEVYTQLNQTDYSAELSQLQASGAQAAFVFFPGGMGINFVKQMRQSGSKLPVLSVFTVDGTTLPALGSSASGVIAGAMWDAAIDNPAGKRFAAAFEQQYKRVPSFYAAASYDAAGILDAAITRLNGKVDDKAALAGAVREAGQTFTSVRGPFAFNVNGMPIQNYYAFEAVAQGKQAAMKQVATPLHAHKDAYFAACGAQ